MILAPGGAGKAEFALGDDFLDKGLVMNAILRRGVSIFVMGLNGYL